MHWIDLAKLAIAPAFVAAVTLIGRRAGPEVAGFLAALPVVGAPILGLLVAAHGNEFGATAALGSAIGATPTMLFALAFALFAPHMQPVMCLAAAYGVYFMATAVAITMPANWLLATLVPWLSWWMILRAFPHHQLTHTVKPALRWDLPMRITATFVLVASVTALARALGPSIAGVLTPFPIITATLALFTHHQAGAAHSAILLRSLVRGLASFVLFFLTLAFLLPQTSAVSAFGGGVVACSLLHAAINRFGIGAPGTTSRA